MHKTKLWHQGLSRYKSLAPWHVNCFCWKTFTSDWRMLLIRVLKNIHQFLFIYLDAVTYTNCMTMTGSEKDMTLTFITMVLFPKPWKINKKIIYSSTKLVSKYTMEILYYLARYTSLHAINKIITLSILILLKFVMSLWLFIHSYNT